jgi:DNA-binding LacI/PurR family transcriptional regulator
MLSGAGWEEFREVWTARRERPDGLLVTDEVLFDEVQVAIRELGIRVPEQLRIVTHANKGLDRRYPFPVTLAQRDTRRYAETLGDMLLKRMRGEPVEPGTTAFPFELTERLAAQANKNDPRGGALSDPRRDARQHAI